MTALFRGDLSATRLAVAAVALALAVRVAYVVVQARAPLFDVAFVAGDAVLYSDLARSIAEGHGMSTSGRPTAYVSPGYPVFLAALFRLGADAFAVGLVQAVLGAVTVLLACVASSELATAATRRVAVGVTGAAAAVYPHLVQWTGYLLTETLFVAWIAAFLALFLRAVNDRAAGLAVIAGIAAGAAALTRPPFLAVAAAVALWSLRDAVRGRAPLSLAIAFAAAASLLPAAWAVRNLAVLGAPVVTSTESGFVFYQGNSKEATGGSRGYVEPPDFVPIDPPVPLDEVAKDRFYLDRALADVAADPARAVARWPAKLWNMWRPAYEDASARNLAITLATYVPLLALGLAGAIRLASRSGPPGGWLPLLILGTWVAIHVIVTGMIRFRLAAELVLLAAAPFGALLLRDALWRRR